ncbi:MAG TPA: DUF222 domain-containing protein [Mycobacteriales bacterium]|nr:DUF222 domain-containing protein [Mycobacteriales bacterium]
MGTLASLRAEATAYAAQFDATRTTVADCANVVREIAAIEAALSVVKAEAAAKAADSGSWRQAGARNAAEHLAKTTGTTIGAAANLIHTGRALDSVPAVREAAVAGTLSAPQAALIADAASAGAPAGETQRLVNQAGRLSLGELRSACAKTKAAADPDPRATRERIRAERSYRRWDDGNGKGFVQLVGPVADLVVMEAAIAPARDRLFQQAHRAGRHERNDALDYDALMATVQAGSTGAPAAPDNQPSDRRRVRGKWWNAKVIIRVDHTALTRGRVLPGETCDINGTTPISVDDVRDAITDDAFIALAITDGQQVTGIAHLGRRPTALQQTALDWQSPTCSAEGCNRTARQTDHREPWARTKHTLLDELDRYCDCCHDKKTYDNWALVPGVGKRPFVPPADPRHPEHRRPADAAQV